MVICVLKAHVSVPKCGHMQIRSHLFHLDATVYPASRSIGNLVIGWAITGMLLFDALGIKGE